MKPIIKWVGGKNKVLPEIRKYYPREFRDGEKIIYVEPFIGSASVYLDVAKLGVIEDAFISDNNKELINLYLSVKYDILDLLVELEAIERDFNTCELKKEFYYEQRARFNELKQEEYICGYPELAALFVFLNKTCFNGLYRVNQKGGFNVPFNNTEKINIHDSENLHAIRELFHDAIITKGDFRQTTQICEYNIDKGYKVFVYFDPPYRHISNISAFTSYTKDKFGDVEQKELAGMYEQLSGMGAKCMLSNSYCDDGFFDRLYGKYNINLIGVNPNINSNATKRGKINEILVTNYEY